MSRICFSRVPVLAVRLFINPSSLRLTAVTVQVSSSGKKSSHSVRIVYYHDLHTMTRRKITFVTGNAKKLKEFKECLGADAEKHFDITNKDVDLPEYQGEPDEVARKKCLEAARQVEGAVICEDTSLCFSALNGLPGPYVKWFVEKIHPDGLVKLLAGHKDKAGCVISTFAYCAEWNKDKEHKVELFEGKKHGEIVEPRGKDGHGFESIFLPEGEKETYAEMSQEHKNEISERSQALQKLQQFLMDSVK